MPETPESNDPLAYMGTGWGFPLRVNVQGSLQLTAAERNIEEAIWIILRTTVGERIKRPEFGSRLSELTFAPMNPTTLLLLRVHVEDALKAWEPRIVVDEVRAEADPIRGRVDLTIDYHPKDSYDPRSIVYPFYLIPSEEPEEE